MGGIGGGSKGNFSQRLELPFSSPPSAISLEDFAHPPTNTQKELATGVASHGGPSLPWIFACVQ